LFQVFAELEGGYLPELGGTVTMLTTPSLRSVSIIAGGAILTAEIMIPPKAAGLVIVPHGTGASRLTPKNRQIAKLLTDARFATLTCDLLTAEEDILADLTGAYRTDVGLLTDRLTEITDWVTRQAELHGLPIAYLAAGSAAAPAVMAAAQRPTVVRALAIRGARLDAALASFGWVHVPTLLFAGEHDRALQAHYAWCLGRIAARDRELVVVPRASASFDEPHTLDDMVEYTTHFFANHLGAVAVERAR
jgi:pimeloyl-ACP methyl ester carboxylesterase